MSTYTVRVTWSRGDQKFIDNRYKRAHTWQFDGGETIPASSSPDVVPAPLSDPSAVDPEEAFIASISSCHMLWFLSIAAKRGYVIDHYNDQAEGIMEKDEKGRLAITKVTLKPRVAYNKDSAPSDEEDTQMHNMAHDECFIANSVKTIIVVESSKG